MIDTPADTTGQARRFAIPLDGALWLLTVLYVLCIIDRQILNILAEPIARELGLSDTQIGLMAGLAFAAFYTVLGIPLARYADRPGSNRVGLMTICLFIWSGMTAVSGLAQNFIQLCLARMGVGVGEAGCTPAAHSMIADLYPADRRSSAMSVYGLGQPVGVVLGSMIGGLVAHQWGWRAAFLVVGIPGILLALLMPILLKDPRHRMAAAKTQGAAGLMEVIGEIAKSKTFVYMLVSGSVIAFLAYGMVVWTNIFFIRHFGLSVAQVGVWLGLVSGLSGAAGTLLGGVLADRFGRGRPARYLTIVVVGLMIALPFQLAAYSASDWRVALVLLIIPYACLNLHYGPAWALVQGVVRPQSRAMAAAVKLFVQALIGIGGGPFLFGLASDMLKSHVGGESVRYVLYGAAMMMVIPMLFYWLASREIAKELRAD
jgi:MFS family permease